MIPRVMSVAIATNPTLTNIPQSAPLKAEPNAYTVIPMVYDAKSQNKSVHLNFPFAVSPFAVATAAKHGTVVILNAIKEIKPGTVIPVAVIKCATSTTPSSMP